MDEQRFQAALERQKDRVYRLAWSYCRSEAEDVLQEVFLRYWRAGPEFPDEARERAWFLKVAANVCKSRLRTPWHRRVVPLEEDLPAPQPEEDGMALRVQALPPGYRAVVHLYYYEGCSVRACAQALGLSETAVQTRLQRAREKLRQMMEKEEKIHGLGEV